jgi:3-hydroxyisobutyrate dehydrogenase
VDIGFVGLGIMGSRMTRHLGEAQHRLALHDIDRAAAERAAMAAPSARVLASAKAVAAECDVVFAMLPAGREVREVALGPNGLADGFRKGGLLVDCSSSEPWITVETAKAMRARGFDMVDAPVSGAREGAEAATLTFMCGGDAAQVERLKPILLAMGKNVFHVGANGAGHAMKAVNNLCSAMNRVIAMEALMVGRAFGIDPTIMADVISTSSGRSFFTMTSVKPEVISRRFEAGFKMDLMIKDVGIACALADRLGVPVPMAALGSQIWRAARAEMGPDRTVADLCRYLEQVAKVELTTAS